MNFKTIIFKLKTAYGNLRVSQKALLSKMTLFLTIKVDTVTLSNFLFLGKFFWQNILFCLSRKKVNVMMGKTWSGTPKFSLAELYS